MWSLWYISLVYMRKNRHLLPKRYARVCAKGSKGKAKDTKRAGQKVFRVAAQTDIGPRKKSNQDSCLAEVAQTPYGDAALLAVCDGVGGLSAGEVASGTVIGWLSEWFENTFPRHLGGGLFLRFRIRTEAMTMRV